MSQFSNYSEATGNAKDFCGAIIDDAEDLRLLAEHGFRAGVAIGATGVVGEDLQLELSAAPSIDCLRFYDRQNGKLIFYIDRARIRIRLPSGERVLTETDAVSVNRLQVVFRNQRLMLVSTPASHVGVPRTRTTARGARRLVVGGAMSLTKVYRYRKYNVLTDDYFVSTRMATRDKINDIGAEVLEDTETSVDSNLLSDGWTDKNFSGPNAGMSDFRRAAHEQSLAVAQSTHAKDDQNFVDAISDGVIR